MIEKIEKHRYYTDQERYEFCRRYKISGKTISEFAKENNIKRTTLRDWVNAYNNINGKFINVSTVAENENNIVENKDLRVNMLSEVEKIKKSSHFSRFDHSIVVIEYKGIKISTSLNQTERLLEKLYDNV